MNKSELVKQVAETTGFTQKKSEAFINAFMSSVTEAIASGDKVTLVGFGTFEARQRAERKGVNPKTGEALTIPAKKSPVFKAGKLFKEAVKA